MKKTLFLLLALGLLPVAAAVADEPLGETHAELASPPVRATNGELYAGRVIRISFPEPMVAEDEVGKAVKPGYLPTISPVLAFDAVWDSTSSLTLCLQEDAARRAIYMLELPGGLVSTNGKAMPGLRHRMVRDAYVWLRSSYDRLRPADPIFFAAGSAADDESVAAAVGKAYAERRVGDEVVESFPVKVRPATVADALAHWNAYAMLADDELTEADRKAFAEAAPDTPLPHVWLVDSFAVEADNERVLFMLPGLGDFDIRTGDFEPVVVDYCGLPNYSMELAARRSTEGQYCVTLTPGQPFGESDPAKAFAATSWFITGINGEELDKQLPLEAAEGVLRPSAEALEAHPELADVAFTPDTEATAATLVRRTLRSGEEISGLGKLIMKAEVGKLRLGLRCIPTLPSMYGAEADKDWADGRDYNWIVTSLRPRRPQVACSVMASGMQEKGSRLIRYRTANVGRLLARVYRVDPRGAAPARLLRAYAKQYTPLRLLEEQDWEKQHELRQAKPTIFNTEGLPVEMQERELPLSAEGASFAPDSFFENAPGYGVYFVELIGTPDAAEWGERKVVAQGFVQMTDIGLMWKSGARGLFAYAYRLSDATALKEGMVYVLDAEGTAIASIPVAEGIARGKLPKGAAFLQLRSGADAYTTRIAQEGDRLYNEYSSSYYLRELGLDDGEFPETSVFMFSDRSVYRPGETLHAKGIIRIIRGDDVVVPRVKSLKLMMMAGGVHKVIPAELAEDGSFTVSIPLEGCAPDNVATLRPFIVFEGDEEGTAPDQAYLREHGVKPDADEAGLLLRNNRETDSFRFCIADFRRNEFELEGFIRNVNGRVGMDVSAMAFTGVPVSQGKVQWTLERRRAAFSPDKYPDFCFGDYRSGSGYYFAAGDAAACAAGPRLSLNRSATLDSEGRGTVEFALPAEEFPGRRQVSITASVTNGNEQTLRCTRSTTVDSSAVYAGLRVSGRLTEAQDAIPVDAVLVQADESDYAGEPIRCEISATRRVFRSYRYGAESLKAVRNVAEESEVYRGELMVGGQPAHADIPTKGPGIYDICIRGVDAEGKPFAAARRQYVWGGSDISPWSYENGGNLTLIADKDSYQPGETARILVQTPVDAELLVTMERGGVRRESRHSVTVDKPVIDIPLEAEDGPVIYVSAFLVQKDKGRVASGLPLVKTGTVSLKVDVPGKRLALALRVPETAPLAGQEWTVDGTVTGADGKPVANAGVAVYAVDEGTLQVAGYTLPDPHGHFYGRRPCGVSTFTTNGQIVSESLEGTDYGNKGVFIGGGDDAWGTETAMDAAAPRLRENFAPCALWLGNARTDAEGRFTATYTQPDTMTRYRLMAVAAAGDRFGSSETAYSVVQPVMLEPSVPASAAAGDTLELPVTLSMLPDSLPEGLRGEVAWTLTLKGENAEVAEASRTVTLRGKEPVTITIPVTLNEVGEARLTWSVRSAEPALAGVGDAVAQGFRVVPPTPYVRERFFATLKSGSTAEPTNWFKARLRPDSRLQATLSTSPLVGAAAGCDFLFRYPYGCLEQTASTLLPWLFREQLERALDIRFPEGRERSKVIAEGVRSLMSRRRADGHFAYWDRQDAASEFSAYALLVLQGVERSMLSRQQQRDIAQSLQVLRDALKQSADTPLLGLLTLATAGQLSTETFDSTMQLHERLHTDEAWVVALAARLIGHPRADSYLAEARKGKADDRGRFMMPPAEACRLLEMVLRAPQKEDTAKAVRDYVAKGVEKGRFLSTWEAGWLCIVLHEYLERRDRGEASRPRLVNGTEVKDGSPLRLDVVLGEAEKLQIRNGTLYASGIAEGHERDAQPNRLVDRGFRVQRRYEKLMDDGSWQPTAEFTVGDVVRVTLSAEGKLGSYMLVEDRLPAAFEAINPALPSQSLPPGVQARADECWHVPGWVDHTEYDRNRVRFFASSWFGGEPLTVSYVARVVRSGQVTAPAARAEFMYRPQVYGLSVPQAFTVKPRP